MADSRLFKSTSSEGQSVATVADIPYVPSKVDIDDLSPRGCLLTDDQLKQLDSIKSHLTENRRYTKKDINKIFQLKWAKTINWPYSILHQEGDFYILYKGVKHVKDEDDIVGKALGVGAHGKVKLVQRIRDLEFFALKVQLDNTNDAKKEFVLLRKVGETPHKQEMALRKTLVQVKSKGESDSDNSDNVVSEVEPSDIILPKLTEQQQYSFMMKLAHGPSMINILEQEEECIYVYYNENDEPIDDELEKDAEGNVIIRPILPPLLRLQLALDTLVKLDNLHIKHHIIHRDLQPGNIIFDLIRQSAKLIDYGQALAMETPLNRSGSERRLLGSGRNFSPELRKRIPEALESAQLTEEQKPLFIYDEKSEIYAIGISLAYLFHIIDEPPSDLPHEAWEGSYIVGAKHAGTDVRYACISQVLPQPIMDSVIELIHAMTAEDISQRITFSKAIEGFKTIIEALKQLENKLSVGVIDIAMINEMGGVEAVAESMLSRGLGEAWLIDSSGTLHDKKSLITLSRQLDEAGLRVGDKCFVGIDQTVLQRQLEEYLTRRPVASSCVLVTPRAQLTAAAAQPVSPGRK